MSQKFGSIPWTIYFFKSSSIFLTFNFDYDNYKFFYCNDVSESWELF